MLYLALILSAVLFLICVLAAWKARHAGMIIGVTCVLFFLMASMSGFIMLPMVAMLSILLGLSALLWGAFSQNGFGVFLKLATGSVVVSAAATAWMVWSSSRRFDELRAKHPYESMERRLSDAKPPVSLSPLPEPTNLRLTRLEDTNSRYLGGWREYNLERLHEHAVELFVNSPGFGIARMSSPTEDSLAYPDRPSPPQPAPWVEANWSPGDLKPPSEGDLERLFQLHDDAFLDFGAAYRFGFYKDRRHVAGFVSHRFQSVPRLWETWDVQRLELVSLLLHDEPAVYVSDHLPEMDKLHGQPTRPLDRFEGLGLRMLEQGDDLFASEGPNGLRFLGAIRSIESCNGCHASNRGDLLGAFSYQLSVITPKQDPDVPGNDVPTNLSAFFSESRP